MTQAGIEVVEGNDDTDWAQWEDSVAFHESQFPVECEMDRLATVIQTSQEADALDPFNSVTKNSG